MKNCFLHYFQCCKRISVCLETQTRVSSRFSVIFVFPIHLRGTRLRAIDYFEFRTKHRIVRLRRQSQTNDQRVYGLKFRTFAGADDRARYVFGEISPARLGPRFGRKSQLAFRPRTFPPRLRIREIGPKNRIAGVHHRVRTRPTETGWLTTADKLARADSASATDLTTRARRFRDCSQQT